MDKMFWMSVLIRFVNDCPALPKPYWTLMGPIEALQTSPVAAVTWIIGREQVL